MGITVDGPRHEDESDGAGRAASSRWFSPPRLRTVGDEGVRRATWLELFFDLVFVVAITQISHELVVDHSAAGFLKFAGSSFPSTSLGSASRSAGPTAQVRPAGPGQAGGRSLRYWCTNAIAMLPSPTAAATRFTGLNRTSPQAKMPGTLVSRR